MSYTLSKNRSKKGGYKVKHKGRVIAEMPEDQVIMFRKALESLKGKSHEGSAR